MAARVSTAGRARAGGVVGGPPTALLLRIEDAAARLGCSARGVYELIDQGRLPAVRLALTRGATGQLRVRAADLERLVAGLPVLTAEAS